ncbi:hypothetical protein [Streptomyces syringium]|uniref:hypothetical protein n=1 Tax=Streptomyces syringium TaxID=76729 RepID=UPI0034560C93
MPELFAPSAQPPVVDFAPLVGTYLARERGHTVTERDGAGHMVYEFVDGMKDLSEPLHIDLLTVTETVFAGTGVGAAFSEDYAPVVFSTLRHGVRLYRHALRPQDRITRLRRAESGGFAIQCQCGHRRTAPARWAGLMDARPATSGPSAPVTWKARAEHEAHTAQVTAGHDLFHVRLTFR